MCSAEMWWMQLFSRCQSCVKWVWYVQFLFTASRSHSSFLSTKNTCVYMVCNPISHFNLSLKLTAKGAGKCLQEVSCKILLSCCKSFTMNFSYNWKESIKIKQIAMYSIKKKQDERWERFERGSPFLKTSILTGTNWRNWQKFSVYRK